MIRIASEANGITSSGLLANHGVALPVCELSWLLTVG